MLLEVAVESRGDWLQLAPPSNDGALLRMHFLQLNGMGVRDLHFDGDDLFILAIPTMVLDGSIRLFRWPSALIVLADSRQPVRFQPTFAEPVEMPHTPGANRAEAFCALTERDDRRCAELARAVRPPGAERCEGNQVVFGDLLRRG
jgi:hypothetical protein